MQPMSLHESCIDIGYVSRFYFILFFGVESSLLCEERAKRKFTEDRPPPKTATNFQPITAVDRLVETGPD